LLKGCDLPVVRRQNTLDALQALSREGVLSVDDFTLLHNGYIMLRRIENKLRLVSDLSLDTLPCDEPGLAILVKRLGFGSGEAAVKRFLEEYQAFTGKIREAFDRIVR